MSAPKAGRPADLSGDDEDAAPSSVHEVKTIPPPGGAPDAYSAATVVKSVVPELLEKLSTSEGAAETEPKGSAPAEAPEAHKGGREAGRLANLADASDGIDVHTGTVVMPETHRRRAEADSSEDLAGAAARTSDVEVRPEVESPASAPREASGGTSTWVAVGLLVLLAVVALVAATR